jgi:4-amino-4-deoxy-L-arabinose transferase-like glycosyltransferase
MGFIPDRVSYSKAAFLFITLLTGFHLYYATTIELMNDEAYYWLWSRHLDMCYFSKGPGVAWTIALGTWLFGDSVFGIRFFAVLLAAATATWTFFVARQMFDQKTAFWSVVLLSCYPLFAVGSVLMTIDPLFVFFWTVATFTFWRALKRTSWKWWIATGVAIGAGTLCKYTNLAQLLSFLFFLAVWKECRPWLRSPRFWTMTVIAFASLIPPLIWNARYQWVTVQHLAHRGALDEPFRLRTGEFIQFWTQQALVMTPLLFIGILIAVGRSLGRKPPRKEEVYLLALFLPLFVFYALLSFNDSGEANWTAPCYIAGTILLVVNWTELVHLHRAYRVFAVAALALGILLTAALHNTLPFNLPPKRDPLTRARGWESLAAESSRLQEQTGATFFIAKERGIASQLAFYLPSHPDTFIPNEVGIVDQFSFWPDYTDGYWGQTALFVTDEDHVPEQLAREFTSVEPVKRFTATAHDRPVKDFYFFVCRSYGGTEDPLPEEEQEHPAPVKSSHK